jgi:glycosyltransferase involved in cell wall biosynthesis
MRKKSLIDTYLYNYSVGEKWRLTSNDTDNLFQVVVIPAYAEKEWLFSTLASIAKNQPSSLEYSFVLCVVNNKENSPSEDIENNLRTIECLDALVKRKSLRKFSDEYKIYPLLNNIAESKMKLGYINAASKGFEMPTRTGGVGLARKIGMDMALRLLENNSASSPVILCLDADTLVRDSYLSVIRKYFTPEIKTAIVAYEHQMPDIYEQQAAIVCYEIFLRYWTLGLRYAGSPWAFHSIGSTIAVSTEAYLEVRGMNRREAGEDFYFLNKLAKTGAINYVKETCVYPSARSSTRVPFGTGKSIQKFLSGIDKEEFYSLYDVRIFTILRNWLKLMNECMMADEDEILTKAGEIHAVLKDFLKVSDFAVIWSKIRRNSKDEKIRARQFSDWFDGFKNLKLINYFTKEVYPKIGMFEALDKILAMSEMQRPKHNSGTNIPDLEDQIEILQCLRSLT